VSQMSTQLIKHLFQLCNVVNLVNHILVKVRKSSEMFRTSQQPPNLSKSRVSQVQLLHGPMEIGFVRVSAHPDSIVSTHAAHRQPEVLAARRRAGAGKMWKSVTCRHAKCKIAVNTHRIAVNYFSFFWSSSFFIHIFTFRSYRCYSRDHGSEAISESVPLMCCKRLHVNLCYMWLRQDRLRGKP
jgi:hypothetical protein